MSKLLYIDIETSGIHPAYNGIVQIALLVEIDGVICETFESKVRLFETDRISQEALDTLNLTVDEIKSYPDPNKVYWKMIGVLDKYIDKYDRDKSQKFYPVGYNVQFDLDFLKEFFLKNGNKYIGSYFNWKKLDVLQLLYWMHYKNKISLTDYKLETACKNYGIALNESHNALQDIVATRGLFLKVNKIVNFQ